ncbi:MAG TPA: serine hydrolase domain-containing protein [Gaiellaceae bacterium]|nr:serine hydrolase domain-containing protein [Gaiellaceae bacterium]
MRSELVSAPESLREELALKLAAAQAEQRLPSVSASVFRGDELVWQEALGVADVDARAAATPDTQYRIGSITKTFTAVGILQLRDAGKLSLDDPLTKHLPESSHGPTLGRMLAHSSGLQREPPGEIWETMQAPSREELLTGTADAEQVLEPGSWWHYSNLAFALLGEVVARAHGGTWEEALQANILDPLELSRTTPAAAERAAGGYFVEPYSDAARLEPDPDLGGAGALGKLWSTTGDLGRWGAFLVTGDDRVLAASTLEEMSHVRAMVDHEGWKLAWGTGLELYRRDDHLFVGHGGAMPGHLAALVVNRKTKIGAAVLTNSGAGASPEKLALDLAVAAIEALPAAADPWQPGEPAPPEIEPLLGRWWVEGSEIVLSWRKDRLEAKLVDGAPGRDTSYFAPEGEDRFRSVEGRERGELLRIVRNDDGSIEKLYFATYPLRREPSTF